MKKNMVFQGRQLAFSLRGVFVLILLACSNFLVVGQQTSQLETEQGLTNAVASYNNDVRQAALLASQYPQILTELHQRQNQTVAAFQDMISDFRQAKQGWFYTLTRYPNLIHTLATLPDGNDKEDIYKLLPSQDENLKKAAWKLYNNEKQDLIEVDKMQIAAQQDFDKSIQSLDQTTKDAFQKLATMPDVLSTLTNNIDLTTKLGQKYKDNPTQVVTDLSTLHDSLVLKNETEMANFRKQLAENPQAQQEFNQAVKDYANANGYNPQNGYNNANYYANPYSYWFGYPSWYGSPMWYPGAFAYGAGFGLGFGFGGYLGYGMPYYGFSNWLNTGYYYRYPTLYHQFGGYFRPHYGDSRGFYGGINNRFNNGNFQISRGGGQVYQNSGGYNRSFGNSYGRSFGGGNFGGGGFHGGGGRGGRR